jgi:hypothetical protein
MAWRNLLAKAAVCFSVLLVAPSAHADWYYYVMKVICAKEELRIIDYSAYNEEGQKRAAQADAIDVDHLSTWKRTENDLNVPDKPLPHVTNCTIPAGTYRVVLTNTGGGYSAPHPVVNVLDLSKPKAPRVLIRDLELNDSHNYKRYEIVFSSKYPRGRIIEERGFRGD